MRIPRLRWQDWSLAAKSAAAVTVPLVLLLVALVFSYRMQHHISAADAEVRRALAIQADIQTLHTLIAEAATGVRGYLLTGRDDFLSPYRHAQQALPDTLASLRRHVRDPVVMASLQRIGELWQRKQQSLEELRTQGRTLPPADLQAHLIGSKGVLDELREEIQTMYARETELVREYSTAARQAFLSNLWVDIVSSVLVLASGLGAFYLLFSGVVRRVQVLVGNAERLSRGEAMESLPNGRDELGLLAERLQNVSVLLAARAAEANSASLAKTRFLSRTSHELRTPLNAMIGYSEILLEDAEMCSKGEQTLEDLRRIHLAGRHLLSLVDEVLDLSKIESSMLELDLCRIVLADFVRDVATTAEPLVAKRHNRLEVQAPPDLGEINTDPTKLRQIMLNLLSNAAKFTENGVIVFSVQRSWKSAGRWLEIEIQDSGIGIAEEDQRKLFQNFGQVAASTASIYGGTGLGLALSQKLCALLGGTITVSSRPGLGSTFTVRIPADAAEIRADAHDELSSLAA